MVSVPSRDREINSFGQITHYFRVPYSAGIELVFQDALLESLRSKNAVKMTYGTNDLAIKIFGGGLRTL